jgi:sigma-B regulation protein RsbU (phosphoserine phosphatase)
MRPVAALKQQLAEQRQEIAELRKQLQQEVDRSHRLIQVLARLSSSRNLSDLLQAIMATAVELLHAETSSLLLVDEETNELTFEVTTGQPGRDVVKYRVPAGQGIAGWVVEHGRPLRIDDPRQDPRFYSRMDEAVGFETRNILAVPLIVQEQVIGVVEIVNKVNAPGFDEQDLELALAFASQASVAIDYARIQARLAGEVSTQHLSYRL